MASLEKNEGDAPNAFHKADLSRYTRGRKVDERYIDNFSILNIDFL
ncbi:hypothetical protein [Pseudomonas phoenicis]